MWRAIVGSVLQRGSSQCTRSTGVITDAIHATAAATRGYTTQLPESEVVLAIGSNQVRLQQLYTARRLYPHQAPWTELSCTTGLSHAWHHACAHLTATVCAQGNRTSHLLRALEMLPRYGIHVSAAQMI
jgi:hypothetical protein